MTVATAFHPSQLGIADAEIIDPSVENPKILPSLKQVRIAMLAVPTARDFFLANFYSAGPFTCIFPKPLLSFSSAGYD